MVRLTERESKRANRRRFREEFALETNIPFFGFIPLWLVPSPSSNGSWAQQTLSFSIPLTQVSRGANFRSQVLVRNFSFSSSTTLCHDLFNNLNSTPFLFQLLHDHSQSLKNQSEYEKVVARWSIVHPLFESSCKVSVCSRTRFQDVLHKLSFVRIISSLEIRAGTKLCEDERERRRDKKFRKIYIGRRRRSKMWPYQVFVNVFFFSSLPILFQGNQVFCVLFPFFATSLTTP